MKCKHENIVALTTIPKLKIGKTRKKGTPTKKTICDDCGEELNIKRITMRTIYVDVLENIEIPEESKKFVDKRPIVLKK